jgi:two-component system, NarL family, response regulator DesR
MTRVLLEHGCRLYREVLSAVMSREQDLDVIHQVARVDEVPRIAERMRPDVAVLVSPRAEEVQIEELSQTLSKAPPDCSVLVVLDRRARESAACRLARLAPRVGIIAAESTVDDLVTGVRRIAKGQPVLDVELAVAALTAGVNPLTDRECEILWLVRKGVTTFDVAKALCLSIGTVRNYLSQILVKTGARTRIEAIRTADEAGWI